MKRKDIELDFEVIETVDSQVLDFLRKYHIGYPKYISKELSIAPNTISLALERLVKSGSIRDVGLKMIKTDGKRHQVHMYEVIE